MASKAVAMVADPQTVIPEMARASLRFLAAALPQLNDQIRMLDAQIMRRAREDETARRLMTIPGVGPLIAITLLALAPSPEIFKRGRDIAAWLGLAPRQHSTGGKLRLGATTSANG
jgi:transposase